jgi:nucleotide-binding universal stress UspA family protein
LVVLHVVLPPLGHEEVVERRDPQAYYEGLRQELRRLQAPQANVHIEHRLEEGDPVTQILRVAEETKSGLIILGTHGRTGIRRVLMGSVAERVLRTANCPVLTVKTQLVQPRAE